MNIAHRIVLAAAFAIIAIVPTSAGALSTADIGCRDAFAKAVTAYARATGKVIERCHKARNAGAVPLDVDCNDPAAADVKGQLSRQQDKWIASIASRCSDIDMLVEQYPECPAPAQHADDGGATTGIDDYEEAAACMLALADAIIGGMSSDAMGSPEETPGKELGKCQGAIARNATKVVQAILRESRGCQRSVDTTSSSPHFACAGSDSRGRVAKSRSRFNVKFLQKCILPVAETAKLRACADWYADLGPCALDSIASGASELIAFAYDLSGGGSTTSTTSPDIPTTTLDDGTTTTTLPDGSCGDSAPVCNGACPQGATCAQDGGDCRCVVIGSGPCAPATIYRTINARYADPPTSTGLSVGWSGQTHEVDIPDLSADVVDATCDENCENCAVSLNVQQGSPVSNCRCTSNPQTTCTAINGSDPASCGSLDPTCRCYFGAPLAISSGGTPVCVINRIRQDYTGTLNLRSGEWFDRIRLASVVHLGLSTTTPCPTCVGDLVVNDGVRDGTCNGGLSSGACDVNGIHRTFGPTSLDCLPSSAVNISGNGLLVDLQQSTGTRSLEFALPCDTPAGEQCACRICTGNSSLACSSNAECAAAGAGTCTASGGAGVRLNQCDSFLCGANGRCTIGPVDTYCDGTTHPDGRGFIGCVSNSDCSAVGQGTCSVFDLRRCFPDPIEVEGDADVFNPLTASLFCVPPTSNPAVNLSGGLPGAGTFHLDFQADIRCQNDPSLAYEFPDGANCFDSSVTTTTLLPLPDCEDSDAPVCGGACPLGGVCTDVDGLCECTGTPVPSCGDSDAPLCLGVCPEGELCSDIDGTCACTIPTLPQCGDADAPLCDGACPLGEVCSDVGGTCECGAASPPPCTSGSPPLCVGDCGVSGVCVVQDDACVCSEILLPGCGDATAPTCAGTCALGSFCIDNGGACQCSPLP